MAFQCVRGSRSNPTVVRLDVVHNHSCTSRNAGSFALIALHNEMNDRYQVNGRQLGGHIPTLGAHAPIRNPPVMHRLYPSIAVRA